MINTVFTWLNTAATISYVLKLDAVTIQGRPLFEGGIYYTETASMWLLFNNYNLIELEFNYVGVLERCFQSVSFRCCLCDFHSHTRFLSTPNFLLASLLVVPSALSTTCNLNATV